MTTAANVATLADAGQPGAVDQLGRAVAHGRLHHAWLWVGGGREAAALALAVRAALLCDAHPDRLADPCRRCPSCRAGGPDGHPDAQVLRAGERAPVGAAQVRQMVARLALSHRVARRRIVWLPAADQLPPAAQNALLKGLEEPRPGTVFLLSTARPGALLATVRSRCRTLRLAAPAPAARPQAPWPALAAALAGGDEGAEARLAALPAAAMAAEIDGLAAGAGPQGPWPALLARAAEWGRDADSCALATALVEMRARDALVAHLGGAHGGSATPPLADVLACAAVVSWSRARATAAQQRSHHLVRLLGAWAGGGAWAAPPA